MPLPSYLESELLRWMNHWKRKAASDYESISVSLLFSWLLAKHADNIFFPNVTELLKIIAVLPMRSTGAERSFSCIRRIYTWLRNTMTTERLSNLAIITMHANAVTIDKCVVCEKIVALHTLDEWRRLHFGRLGQRGISINFYFFYFVAFIVLQSAIRPS